MADTKISALPAVAAELNADEFPCNQAGVTKKETRAQIVSTITAAHNAHVAAAVLAHPNDSVTDIKLRNSAARSVIGRAAAAGGDPADIIAAADDRVLARTAGTVAFQQVTVGMIPAGIITATEIANRTRTVFIPVCGSFSAVGVYQDPSRDGYIMYDGATNHAFGHWRVPSDFASGLSIEVCLHGHIGGAGNLRVTSTHSYGADGEIWNTHSNTSGVQDLAGPAGARYQELQSVALANAALNDHIQCDLLRAGGHANDTYGEDVYVRGWLATYTADS